MKRSITILLSLAVLGTLAGAIGAAPKEQVKLTVYNKNFALVKDTRWLEAPLKAGLNVVRFRDVASTIDATSVYFRSLTDPAGTTVVEQNYEFDLVNANKLLHKYIDKPISIFTKDGELYEGTLLSFDKRQIVLADEKQKLSLIERGENIKKISFSALPEGLLTRPTLVWELQAEKRGRHLVQVSYIARQMNWSADYNLVINEKDTAIDLSGWVTINNRTGTAYKQAMVKLLAGDTGRQDLRRRQLSFGPDYYKTLSELAPTAKLGPDPSRAFAEYRMYKLPEATTVNNNQVKQIELITAANIPVKKIYVYDGAKIHWNWYGRYWDSGFGREENKKVNVLLEFENRADRNLGLALPKGKCRVYKRDDDKSLEFIGEDLIDHTSRDEKVTLYIGDAFDSIGERKQTRFHKVSDRICEEDFEIKIRNHKDEAVTVEVLEKLYRWSEWTMLSASHEYKKINSRTIIFPVQVPKDGEVVITYSVRYKW